MQIPLSKIVENPWQTRLRYDDDYIEALAGDILKNGLLQTPLARAIGAEGNVIEVEDFYLSPKTFPMFLEENPEARFQLAFGHNRYRALQFLAEGGHAPHGIDVGSMPLELRPLPDRRMALFAWSENEQRKDLSPHEEAMAIRRRMDDFELTQSQVADWLDIGRSTVSNKLRLLKLPDEVQEHVRNGDLSERQAQALLSLYDLKEEHAGVLADLPRSSFTPRHPDAIEEKALEGAPSSEVRSHVNRLKSWVNQKIREIEATNPLPDDQQEAEDECEDTTAEIAELLQQEYGIQVTPDRGEEDLRAILEEAKAQSAKEQPNDAKTLEGRVEYEEEWAAGEHSGPWVGDVDEALRNVRDHIKAVERRDTWVREQIGEVKTPVMIAVYQQECTALNDLKRRLKDVRQTLKSDPPQYEYSKSEVDSPAGDGMPGEPEVATTGLDWPEPQLPDVAERIPTFTKAELEETHRKYRQEQWGRYGSRFHTSALKQAQFDHVQAQLQFHANLEAVYQLRDDQLRELLAWMNENTKAWGNGDELRRAKQILNSIFDVEELGEMEAGALERFRLAETRRAATFCYHVFYEERPDRMPAEEEPAATAA